LMRGRLRIAGGVRGRVGPSNAAWHVADHFHRGSFIGMSVRAGIIRRYHPPVRGSGDRVTYGIGATTSVSVSLAML